MFNIEVRSDHANADIRKCIEERMKQMKVDPRAISSVVVAKDNDTDYGACIRRSRGFVGGRTHSPGSAGKSLPYFANPNEVVSDLVFPFDTFQAILNANEAEDIRSMYEYVVCHEFGHAIDSHLRRTINKGTATEFKRSTPIDDPVLSSFYGLIVITEFAADFHAAKSASKAIYDVAAAGVAQKIQSMQSQYGINTQLPWYIMSEQAHVVGMSIGNPDLKLRPYAIWSSAGQRIATELEGFATDLAALVSSYPSWDDSTIIGKLILRCNSLYAAIN